jgi:hypothetical protein
MKIGKDFYRFLAKFFYLVEEAKLSWF